jgi:lipopolysaccharide assembly protein A
MASSPPHSAAPRRSRAVRPGRILALVLVVLAVVFIAQNRDRMQISFFTLDVSAPTWLLLTIMTVLGVAVGALLGRARR